MRPILIAAIIGLANMTATIPPPKLDLVKAARLDRDLRGLQLIQAQAQQAKQELEQLAAAAAAPLVDDLTEICKVGGFSIEDALHGVVRVNPSTGEITRPPKPDTSSKEKKP